MHNSEFDPYLTVSTLFDNSIYRNIQCQRLPQLNSIYYEIIILKISPNAPHCLTSPPCVPLFQRRTHRDGRLTCSDQQQQQLRQIPHSCGDPSAAQAVVSAGSTDPLLQQLPEAVLTLERRGVQLLLSKARGAAKGVSAAAAKDGEGTPSARRKKEKRESIV